MHAASESVSVHAAPVVRLSVVVPAYRSPARLADALQALRGSRCPVPFELICVDDGSDDRGETAAVADRYADRVVRLDAPSAGPAAARNAGATIAVGEWVCFVDADVRVGPDTLSALWQSIQRHPEASAIFGCYDARVADQPLVSQYRNLMHRYVHLRGAGPAETFWAGLGAVRRDRFVAVGGFDAARFPRPSVEDIDLGYRLRDAGDRLVLDPSIEATHLKVWTLGSILRTDFASRALPWLRLLLARGATRPRALNVRPAERLRVAVVGAALAGAVLALGSGRPRAALGLLVLLVVTGASHLGLLAFLYRAGGLRLLCVAIPLQVLYYASNAIAAVAALARQVLRR